MSVEPMAGRAARGTRSLVLALIVALAFGPLPLESGAADTKRVRAAAKTNGDASAATPGEAHGSGALSLAFRDAALTEVFEMLSRRERVNILVGKGVSGTVSVNLYEVTVDQAIRAIASAAGYVVEIHNGDYVVLERKDAGLDTTNGNTDICSFKVQYSDPKTVADILAKHLSRYGKITPLPDRRVLLVEDMPEFLDRFARLLQEVDVQPRQILIEAKILEIALDDSETFGIDWSKAMGPGGASSIGTAGLSGGSAAQLPQGFFFNVVNRSVNAFLSALSSKGRVHTLSTPRLLALENQEATTKIGDNIGYKVTTTINNVTTESIQFLETGVILRFTSSVDERGRVVMKIHPEVSSGSVSGGIPSKNTTEVTTQLVADDGQSILIGGLIQSTKTFKRAGVPLLGDVPGIGQLFSRKEVSGRTSETVVLITPHVLAQTGPSAPEPAVAKVQESEQMFLKRSTQIERTLEVPRLLFKTDQ